MTLHLKYVIYLDGKLFACGHNGFCQLGIGTANQELSQVLVTANIQNKNVKEVACGAHHSMVLTQDGEVAFPKRLFTSLRIHHVNVSFSKMIGLCMGF